MEKHLEHTLTTEQLHGLFEGKRLVIDYAGFPQITLYPPNHGVFMTFEKFAKLRRKIGMEALADTDGFFLEVLGEEMFERVFGRKN